MKKTILITGSTDGIGLATAKTLGLLGHTVLLHGRSGSKLEAAKATLEQAGVSSPIYAYQADLSSYQQVKQLIQAIQENHTQLDVLINNAGVFVVNETKTADNLDARFMVNTIAPFMLTQAFAGLLGANGRVVNLSSAAQTSVMASELASPSVLSDSAVYAKSKLAITMWSFALAKAYGTSGPAVIAVNPKSFLGSKMVESAYGVAGSNLQIGADILVKAATSDEFAQASGRYFDNDIGQFSQPHRDALDPNKNQEIVDVLDQIIEQLN